MTARAMFELVDEDEPEALRAATWPEPHPAHDLSTSESDEEWAARVTRETVQRWGESDPCRYCGRPKNDGRGCCSWHPGEHHGICSEAAR